MTTWELGEKTAGNIIIIIIIIIILFLRQTVSLGNSVAAIVTTE